MALPSRPHAFAMEDYRDLRRKLEWEIERYRQAQRVDDVDALIFTAWNASVTAWHMVDWVHAATPADQRQAKGWLKPCDLAKVVLATSPALNLCRQFATGSKHEFVEKYPRHDVYSETLATETNGAPTWVLRIRSSDELHDPLEVFEEAWAFWERFTREHGIPAL